MSFKFNPFTGLLDYTNDTSLFAEKVSDVFVCLGTVQIGDLVRPSTATSNTVETIPTNSYPGLALGVVISKPTTTSCEVLISGKLSDLTGLDFGKVMFIGVDGKLTTTPPLTGHSQKMGIAMTSSTAFLLPSSEKVVLS
jgi:hypothetical protein